MCRAVKGKLFRENRRESETVKAREIVQEDSVRATYRTSTFSTVEDLQITRGGTELTDVERTSYEGRELANDWGVAQ